MVTWPWPWPLALARRFSHGQRLPRRRRQLSASRVVGVSNFADAVPQVDFPHVVFGVRCIVGIPCADGVLYVGVPLVLNCQP